jgi:hypothetical protein
LKKEQNDPDEPELPITGYDYHKYAREGYIFYKA